MKEKFPNSRKPSHRWVCGEFWNFRGQHNQEKKRKTKPPQNMCLNTSASGEVAQTLVSATSEWGLDRDPRAAASVLKGRPGPGCPEDNLREQT